jgi:hypothetical protein
MQTTDPAALAAYAVTLRPVLANLRTLVEDATAEPSKRIKPAPSFAARLLLPSAIESAITKQIEIR